jgi:hypothetical protein
MDLRMQRLNQGEKVAAGSALALLICMFLGWFNFGFAVSNAWDSLHYVSPLLAIAIATTLAIALLKASGRTLDIPDGSVIFVLGCAAALLILFRLIDPVSAGEASPFGGGEGEVGSSPEAGLFLSLFAAVGIAVGGYLATGGRAVDQLKELLASRGGPALPQQPPPPPPPSDGPPAPPQPAQPPTAPLPPVTLPPVAAPPPPPQPETHFCEHCGAQLRDTDRFCGECGKATA